MVTSWTIELTLGAAAATPAPRRVRPNSLRLKWLISVLLGYTVSNQEGAAMSDNWKATFSAGIGGICAILYDASGDANHLQAMSHGLARLHLPGAYYLTIVLIIGIAMALCWIFDEKSRS